MTVVKRLNGVLTQVAQAPVGLGNGIGIRVLVRYGAGRSLIQDKDDLDVGKTMANSRLVRDNCF